VGERVKQYMSKALSESRVRENRLPGLMSGVWKRSMVEMVGHPQTKGRANRGKQTSTFATAPHLDSTLFHPY
jgi:hypothetical protein